MPDSGPFETDAQGTKDPAVSAAREPNPQAVAPPGDQARQAAGALALRAGFLLTGAVTVLLGPALPELAREWRAPVEGLGALFVAQFLGSAVGSTLSSLRPARSLRFGYLLVLLGLLSLAALDWPTALGSLAIVGLGLGLAIPATNLLVAHRQPARRGAALSSLNLIWGVGAVACPVLFAARPGSVPVDGVLLLLAVASALVLVFLLPSGGGRAGLESASALQAERPADDAVAAVRGLRGQLAAVAAIMFLYVGIENSVGGWLISVAERLPTATSTAAAWVGSSFWGALLAGRAAAPLLLRRMGEPALYVVGIGVAAAGLVGLLAGGSPVAAALAAAAVGVGLAPLFPLTVSLLAELTALDRSRNTGWAFALAGGGGAALPWMTGRVGAEVDRLATGFVVPLLALALLAGLFALAKRGGRPAGSGARPAVRPQGAPASGAAAVPQRPGK